MRKVQKTAEESFDDLVRKVLAGIRHKYTPSSGKVEFPNGSRILLGGYKDAADIDKYIGIDYDGIVVEEAGQLTEDKLHKIMGSRRSVRSDWRIRSYLTANPGGLGHAYLRTKAVVPTRMGKIEDWLYIHSMYYDNPYLPDEYITW